MIHSGGNGKSEDPEIEATFEPIDDETQQVQDRWVEFNKAIARLPLAMKSKSDAR